MFADDVGEDIFAWPLADIEATFLSDDGVLEAMIRAGFVRDEYALLPSLRDSLNGFAEGYRENAVAEVAQRLLRQRFPNPFPTKGRTTSAATRNGLAHRSCTSVHPRRLRERRG